VAKRKRRRSAGPPPVHNPKRATAQTTEAAKAAPKRRPDEPVPPSFRGVLIRAAIVAAIFYPYLVYVVDESPGAAFVVTLIAFVLMLPLGIWLDRFRYKRQLRRYEERRARPSGR
jgi:Flp pilus assembly protein TadB